MDIGRDIKPRPPNEQNTAFQPFRSGKENAEKLDGITMQKNEKTTFEMNPEKVSQEASNIKSIEQSFKRNFPEEKNSHNLFGERNSNRMFNENPRNDEAKASGTITKDNHSNYALYNEECSEENKRQIEKLFEIAQVTATKGEYQLAINIYNKILKINENSTAAWIALGHCFAMIDESYKALSSYQQALILSPESQKDDQLWYGIGLLYQKVEDWVNAEISFKHALKLHPSSHLKGDILFHLGTLMRMKGEHREATKILTQSILLGHFPVEKMVDILCKVGSSLEEVNDINEAIKTYKYVLILDENNLRALQCLGWLCVQQDKLNEALEYLNKASSLDNEDLNTMYMKARCYLKLKQYPKAYDCLHQCLGKDTTNTIYWSSLGILFGELMQVKQAHECFSSAIKFGTKSPENYFNMGCLLELCRQPNEAVLMYDKAIELQPTFQLAHARKLGIYAQLENKAGTLEVQFKHHKFSLNFQDSEKEKEKEREDRLAAFSAQLELQATSTLSAIQNLHNSHPQQQQTSKHNNQQAQSSFQAQSQAIPNNTFNSSLQQIVSQLPANYLNAMGFKTPGSKISGLPNSPKMNQNDINTLLLQKQIPNLQQTLKDQILQQSNSLLLNNLNTLSNLSNLGNLNNLNNLSSLSNLSALGMLPQNLLNLANLANIAGNPMSSNPPTTSVSKGNLNLDQINTEMAKPEISTKIPSEMPPPRTPGSSASAFKMSKPDNTTPTKVKAIGEINNTAFKPIHKLSRTEDNVALQKKLKSENPQADGELIQNEDPNGSTKKVLPVVLTSPTTMK